MSYRHSNDKDKQHEIKPHRFEQFILQGQLDLSQQALTDNDMPDLVKFLHAYPEIKVLNLSLNNIGDEGIAYFADRNQYVTEVNLLGNIISDNGLAVFAYKNQVIEQVNFSHNLISDQGINNFAQINRTCFHCQFSIIQVH